MSAEELINKAIVLLFNHLAEVIATCALIASIISLWQTSKYKKLSVRPILVGSMDTKETVNEHSKKLEREYSLILRNGGLGPALIQEVEIEIDGELLNFDRTDVDKNIKILRAAMQKVNKTLYVQSFTNFAPQTAILPGEGKPYLVVQGPSEAGSPNDKIETKVKYTSIFGEKFKLDSRTYNTSSS